ncbi:MAG: 50S ribosomal protein L17 [Deltaproteobacteria bacterium]|nr:50S ribosomal protein L17 [Deltaproteobacteria bacterium]
MRHRKAGKKLGRTSSHRNAMLRNLVTSLLKHERVVTTDTKAKLVRSTAEKMITLGKKGTLHARRQALAFIRDREVAARVFDEYSARYATRAGGYTRVVKTGYRVGDSAPVSIVELISDEKKKKAKDKAAKSKKKEKSE